MRDLNVCMTCIHLGMDSNDEYRLDLRYSCEFVIESYTEGVYFVKKQLTEGCPLRMEQLIATQEGS